MSVRFDFRPLLAAAGLLVLLVGAYEAVRWLPRLGAARPAAGPAADWAASDTLAAPAPVVPAPAAATSTPAERPPPCVPQRRQLTLVPLRLVLRRYVGTVDGEPATARLQWYHPDSVTGSFYWHRREPEYGLCSWPDPPRGFVRLAVSDDNAAFLTANGAGEWRLTGRPGAELRGTWHDTTGRHPFALRESYTGAVRAEVRTLWLRGGRPRTQYEQYCGVPTNLLDYLYLPSPQAVVPALRRTLSQPLAAHRRRMAHELTENDRLESHLIDLQLNDFNLLGYRVVHEGGYFADGSHTSTWSDCYLFDLASGRRLTLVSQLRPGYEEPLQRLLTRHLRQQYDALNRERGESWLWEEAADPAGSSAGLPYSIQNDDTQGLFLTGAGLTAYYPASQLYADTLPIRGDVPVGVPYRELRPLVRPGTPLARMLQARGLW